MTPQPDTAAIRANYGPPDHPYWRDLFALCDALDAARAENGRLDLTARMHFGDWEREKARAEVAEAEVSRLTREYLDAENRRAEAEARIAAYLAQVIERDDRIAAGLNVCDDMDANGNSRELGDPTAAVWHKAAQLVRRALTEGTGQ